MTDPSNHRPFDVHCPCLYCKYDPYVPPWGPPLEDRHESLARFFSVHDAALPDFCEFVVSQDYLNWWPEWLEFPNILHLFRSYANATGNTTGLMFQSTSVLVCDVIRLLELSEEELESMRTRKDFLKWKYPEFDWDDWDEED
jgi:hypothetical protein